MAPSKEKKNSTIPAPRFTPTIPHFFKPILPGFEHQLLIPISFFKYLSGERVQQALLRSHLGNWAVKVKGRRFEDGWTEFAKCHDLHVGDFIVFGHRGGAVFDVMVLQPNGCGREYTGSEEEFYRPPRASPEPEATSSLKHSNHSNFVLTVQQYSLDFSVLYIPTPFARLNGLKNRSCEVILRDDQQRLWPAKINQKSDGQVYIRQGWRDFYAANGLKKGDNFMIQLSKMDNSTLVMDFNRLETTVGGKQPSGLRVQHFVSTFRPYSVKWSKMYLPKEFSTSNGLEQRDCIKIVIIDPKGRQWSMSLRNDCHKNRPRVFIRGNWGHFAIANDLRNGHHFKLELQREGKIPAMKFYKVTSKYEAGSQQA